MTHIKKFLNQIMVEKYHKIRCPHCKKTMMMPLIDILDGRDIVCRHCLQTTSIKPEEKEENCGAIDRSDDYKWSFFDEVRVRVYREYAPTY